MANTREQIAPELKWHLEDIYKDDSLWEADFQTAKEKIKAFPAYAGRLGESSETLLSALKDDSAISYLLEKLYVYAHMRKDEDNGNTTYQAMTDRAMQLASQAAEQSAFMDPELVAMDPEQLKAWANRPEFCNFRFHLLDLDRQRAHTLTKGEERIMALASEPLNGIENIFTLLTNVDMEFGKVKNEAGEEVPLTHGSYGLLIQSPDRSVREGAYRQYYAAFHQLENTLAATYGASVKADVFQARARGFAGACERALFEDNAPLSVYEQLIEAVHEKLPAMGKYMVLKKRALKLDQLCMYDLYTPIVPDCDLPMTYEEAKQVVKEALVPLGENYQKLLDEAYENGWIDVVETPGKTSGAYSWGVYGTHPFVLLNHQDNVDHAFTLAHELGHAMHSYHSDHALPYELAQYRIMVAEVASTVNESLMMRHLLNKETDPKKRAYLINQFLEQFRTTCFRQTMFAEFELKAHRMQENGEPLTKESLSRIYRELNELYYPGVEVDADIAIEWMRIPHFYGAFYVYKYATGLCTAVALAEGVLNRGEKDRYLAFLSSGGSDYPIELLKKAGVDLTKKESIVRSLDVFEAYVDELDKIL